MEPPFLLSYCFNSLPVNFVGVEIQVVGVAVAAYCGHVVAGTITKVDDNVVDRSFHGDGARNRISA